MMKILNFVFFLTALRQFQHILNHRLNMWKIQISESSV